MTSPQVSEQEVEAAAKILNPVAWGDITKAMCPAPAIEEERQEARRLARAALVAAAQVRERPGHGHKILQGLRDAMAGNFARVTIEGEVWERVRTVSSEPDSGPDVLGERKGG